jgi:hypothetical protein
VTAAISFNGIPVIAHPLAVQYRTKLERHPIKKRRRNWRWTKVEEPGCFQLQDGTLLMHPKLVAKLLEAQRA